MKTRSAASRLVPVWLLLACTFTGTGAGYLLIHRSQRRVYVYDGFNLWRYVDGRLLPD